MRYLRLQEVLRLHQMLAEQSGGAVGVRDLGALEAALAQPKATFAGEDLYPTVVDKAASLGFGLISNHPFIDGNKRIGHACAEVFLRLNGYDLSATVDDGERIILGIAAGQVSREEFRDWLLAHVEKRPTS